MSFRGCTAGLIAGLVMVSGAGWLSSSVAQPTGGEVDTDYGRMVLVLDASGSMAEFTGGGRTRIAAAKQALRTVVNGLPDEAQVGLRVFGAEVFSRNDDGSCADSQLVVEPDVDNRDALLDAVGDYEPYGETPIPHALREAAKDLGGEGQRSIVLVSDGESTCDPDPCEVAAELAEAGIDLQIDVVGLSVSGKARQQLQCIAEKGNGSYYDADSAKDIEQRLQRAAARALRPFTLTGTPVEGGPEEDPTPVAVGDWTDLIGPRGSATETRSYLVEKTAAGSMLRVSAHTQGQRGDEGLKVEMFDEAHRRCDLGNAIRQIDTRRVVGVQAVSSDDDRCDEPGRYRITVTRFRLADGTVPFGLRVAEEPPVTEPGVASEGTQDEVVAPVVTRAAQPVDGGSSFSNAGEIGPGRWASDLVPGEALVYRFRLEFGQSARIRVRHPRGTAAIREHTRLFPPLSQIVLYNPMQAQLSPPRDAEFSGRAGGGEARTLITSTPSLGRNLVDWNGYNGVGDYSMSGDYYLAVSLQREDYSIEFPFTIDLEVVGDPAEGPTYADGVTWSVADGVGDTGEGEEPPATAEPNDPDASGTETAAAREEDTGSAMRLMAAGAAALLALGGVIGGALLWRRRRAA